MRIFLSFFIGVCLFVYSGACGAFTLGKSGLKVSGFMEHAHGIKLGTDTTKHTGFNMLEQRLQLKTTFYPEFIQVLEDWMAAFTFKGDFTVDEYYGGKTGFQIRELNLALSPLESMDVKIGRQIFTWGTGDYLFVNDLFPKDYVSFYAGREDEYLKKPSDGIKLSFYSDIVNFDFIAIPLYEPNTLFKGDRLSFFDSFQGGIAGRDSDRNLTEPARQAKNTEFATRLYRNFGSYETAFYTFRGFYKMPRGYLNERDRELFYPRLDAYGASVRGPFLGGIANFETAYYNSRQDRNGNNRLIENSMLKCLAGYSRDLGNDLGIGFQYLYEQTLKYGEYKGALLWNDFCWDEYRHLFTFRITKLFKNQTVKVNLFSFFSPSDMDGYLRPSIEYDITDNWKAVIGANLAWGRDDYTEFGQAEHNKNIYVRLRYSF